MEERDGLAERYGRSEMEEVGDDLFLGRTTEPSDTAYWGFLNVVASCEGVMNAAATPCSNAVWAGSMRDFAWVCNYRQIWYVIFEIIGGWNV